MPCDQCNASLDKGDGHSFYSTAPGLTPEQPIGTMMLCDHCMDTIVNESNWETEPAEPPQLSPSEKIANPDLSLKYRQTANAIGIIRVCKAHGFSPAAAKEKARELAAAFFAEPDQQSADRKAMLFWTSVPLTKPSLLRRFLRWLTGKGRPAQSTPLRPARPSLESMAAEMMELTTRQMEGFVKKGQTDPAAYKKAFAITQSGFARKYSLTDAEVMEVMKLVLQRRKPSTTPDVAQQPILTDQEKATVAKLVSNDMPTFESGLTEAASRHDSGDYLGALTIIRESIKVRSGKQSASFYESGQYKPNGSRSDIIELARMHQLLDDPAYSGELIHAAIGRDDADALQALPRDVQKVGSMNEWAAYQLLVKELIYALTFREHKKE